MTELWQPILGYEGLYEVSNMGSVRSLDGKRWNGQAIHRFKGRVLTPLGKNARYFHVALSKNKKVKCRRIHELVAEHFLPPCPGKRGRNGWHIDHINNNPKDNRAENLQWLTHKENVYTKPRRKRDGLGRWVNNPI